MPREFLGSNTQEQDVLLLDPGKSVFAGQRPDKFENLHLERKDFRAQPSSAFGTTFDFLPSRTMDLMGPITLKMSASAVTSAGAGANYPRWPDYWPYHAVQEVRIDWTANHLQTLTGDDMYIIHAVTRVTDDNLEEAVYGGLQAAAAQRAINATAVSDAYLPIPAFWCSMPANYLPYNPRIVRADLRIQVTLRALIDVIETDGAAPAGTITCVLRTDAYFLGNSGVRRLEEETRMANQALRTTGYTRLVTTYERQQLNVANSTAEQTFTLNQLRRPTKEYLFYVRQDADIASGTQTARDRFNFQEVATHKMDALGRNMVPAQEHRYDKYVRMNRYHSADPVDNIYGHSYSLVPEAHSTALGYLNFTAISQPELLVTMNSAFATTGKIDLLLPTFNVYTVTPTGDIRVLFA